jgi:PAS domain S-box-containing protein
VSLAAQRTIRIATLTAGVGLGILGLRLAHTAPLFTLVVALAGVLAVTQMAGSVGGNDDAKAYRQLFDETPQPLWVWDCETLRFLAVNQAAVQQYGFSAEEFLRMRLGDLHPATHPAGNEFAGLSGSRTYLSRHQRKNGSVFVVEVTGKPLSFEGRRAVLALNVDMTERKRAEKRALAFSNLGRRLGAARTAKEAAQMLMDAAEELFGWDACTFDLCAADQSTISTVLYIDTINGRRLDVSADCVGTAPSAYARRALEKGAQLVLRTEPIVLPDDAIPFGDKAQPSASLMYVPVRKNANVIGVLSIQSYRPRAYAEEDLRALQALADHCSGALERVRAEQELERLNHELEKRVRERTAQLEAINKELETFSYSVSHDLRAPLRSIRGFSEVLLERHASQLDARGQEFLRRACESSHQMDLLIEDLLKFSRAGRTELVRQAVNLSALAETVVGELHKLEPERSVQFQIAPNLQADADGRLLRVVMDNLLRNAWKFTGKVKEARIEVGSTLEPEPAFYVRDNGAGFDMQYVGKLFGVFQRLHSTSEFPGTGVGLATVQRIINRHGGRVWATGARNQGATLYFTLPKNGEVGT